MRLNSTIRPILSSIACTFAGLGGIVFHLGHGPTHFLCVAIAGVVTVFGTGWSFYINHRIKNPVTSCRRCDPQ